MSKIMKYQSTMLCGELSGGYSTKTPCIGKDDSIPEWLRKNVEKKLREIVLRSKNMEYLSTMLCSGYSHELKPCKHIMKCDLCTGPFVDTNGNEQYVCGPGVVEFKCKRDNPNWKPLTKQQFIELYKQLPDRTNISIGELLERAIIDGIVK